MLCSVLFAMVFQNIKADMFLSSNILYQQNLRKGSTCSVNTEFILKNALYMAALRKSCE